MKIRNFEVEMWMNRYETTCTHNLAETCVESLTVEQLLDMAGKRETFLEELLPLKLTYGTIEGTDRLRNLVAGLYEHQRPENVIVTHGAAGANALVHQTLIEPEDVVVTVLPTYQQHYSIPESFGAQVRYVNLREENGFLPDLAELEAAAGPGTRLIAINNPNNPTGSLMGRETLEGIARIAAKTGAYVLSDEVYRGIDQDGDGFTVSIADLYERGISTASMSKSFSLAGLRLGWVAGPEELIHRISAHRDYTTISVGMVDDLLACIALETKDAILERSRSIVRTNLEILDEWVAGEPAIGYLRPRGGTTALLRYGTGQPSEELAEQILAETGVLLTPGSAFDIEGCLRIGYANNQAVLREGLERLSGFFAQQRSGSAATAASEG
ncbi:aminotransferase [Arthrobacter ginkgonis]|uniref:Aminotransferase n=1 Tax=Arthrobacter ginkgonis TaxID=1630594 RepID=A0ABP7CHX3_9MICC